MIFAICQNSYLNIINVDIFVLLFELFYSYFHGIHLQKDKFSIRAYYTCTSIHTGPFIGSVCLTSTSMNVDSLSLGYSAKSVDLICFIICHTGCPLCFQIPGCLKFFVTNSRYFHTNFSYKKSRNVLKQMQGSHFSCDTKFHVFSRLFHGKGNEIQGQFGFKSVFVLIM